MNTTAVQALLEEATIDLEQAIWGLKRAAVEAVGENRRLVVRAELDAQSALDYAQEALDAWEERS